MKGMNKMGQQMTLGTIIAIVLGIAVLVFLIFGFSTGWNNMWSKVTGYTSGANVQDKIRDCETDCSLGEKSAYCSEEKELRFFNRDKKLIKIKGTCSGFASGNLEVDNNIIREQIKKMGFNKCSSISCDNEE